MVTGFFTYLTLLSTSITEYIMNMSFIDYMNLFVILFVIIGILIGLGNLIFSKKTAKENSIEY